MDVKSTIGNDKYEEIRKLLQATFPGHGQLVSDDTVDGFVRALWRDRPQVGADLGLPKPPPEAMASLAASPDDAATTESASYPLYVANATHHRVRKMASTESFESEFLGKLPLVRVALPQSFDGMGRNPSVSTPIGTVYFSADHLVGNIDLINDKYGDPAHLGYRPARVDLITPARLDGTRFGAIAVYLGYKNADDAAPSFYILEAGTATGKAEMLYFAPTMDYKITSLSGYQPTPFSTPEDTYHGWLTMSEADPNEPGTMVVIANMPNLPFYIKVSVDYEPVPALHSPWPALITLEAAERVATIAQSMGVPSGEPLTNVLAALGRLLPWIIEPPRS